MSDWCVTHFDIWFLREKQITLVIRIRKRRTNSPDIFPAKWVDIEVNGTEWSRNVDGSHRLRHMGNDRER